jgi:hypothetical protein
MTRGTATRTALRHRIGSSAGDDLDAEAWTKSAVVNPPSGQLLTRFHVSTIGMPATSPAMCQVPSLSIVHWNANDLPLTT